MYEWRQGKIALVSDGRSARAPTSSGLPPTGATRSSARARNLVGHDFDREDTDIYDARVNGGFAEPVSPAPCAGEGCQGQTGAAPAEQSATTNSFNGPPNKVERKTKPKKKQKHKKKRRPGKAKHGKTTTKKGR